MTKVIQLLSNAERWESPVFPTLRRWNDAKAKMSDFDGVKMRQEVVAAVERSSEEKGCIEGVYNRLVNTPASKAGVHIVGF